MEPPEVPDLDRVIEILESAKAEASDGGLEALLEASTTLLLAATAPSPIGQCKEADPFAPIYVVFDLSGHRYECTHKPPHSSLL